MSSFVLFLVIAQCVSAEGKSYYCMYSLLILFFFSVLVFFSQNTSVVEICAGGNFTLTCVTDTGTLVWYRIGSIAKTFNVHSSDNPAPLGDHITVYLTSVSGSYITSVANITRAPLALNGIVIQCIDRSGEEMGFHPVGNEKTLLVSGIMLYSVITISYLILILQ